MSKTGDPTGEYWQYAFVYPDAFPDYPKMGVWPDAYYVTFNMFSNDVTAFEGGRVCAYNRARMLEGAPPPSSASTWDRSTPARFPRISRGAFRRRPGPPTSSSTTPRPTRRSCTCGSSR